MARKTIYCAQQFWRRSEKLEGGVVHQFTSAERAVEGAIILAGGADGVAVYSLTGEPDVDYWDEPTMIMTFGDLPEAPAGLDAA